jgi:hypothetical protein
MRALPRFVLLLGLLVLASTLPGPAHVALPHHHAGILHLRPLSRAPSRFSTQLSVAAGAIPSTVGLSGPWLTTGSNGEAEPQWVSALISHPSQSRGPPLLGS